VASGDATLGLVGCYSGQVLKSDGSLWSCAEDTDTGVTEVVGGGGVTGSILGRTLTLGSTATPTNTAGAIVARDGTGSFAAESIGLTGNLGLPSSTAASAGVLAKGGAWFLHDFGTYNSFVGSGAGNFTLTGSANSAFGHEALHANTRGRTPPSARERSLNATEWAKPLRSGVHSLIHPGNNPRSATRC
jgi:hypothetical protein